MEQHLQSTHGFNGANYGIADIALVACADVAADGGFGLSAFAAIVDWRARATRDCVPMPAAAAANAALFAASNTRSFH